MRPATIPDYMGLPSMAVQLTGKRCSQSSYATPLAPAESNILSCRTCVTASQVAEGTALAR